MNDCCTFMQCSGQLVHSMTPPFVCTVRSAAHRARLTSLVLSWDKRRMSGREFRRERIQPQVNLRLEIGQLH